MSEHRTNTRAQMATAGGRQLGVELLVAFAPKGHIVIVPPANIRATEGRTEILGVPPVQKPDGSWSPGQGESVWHSPPPDAEVVADGATLGIDKLDLVVNLVATAVGGMVSADGRVIGRRRHLREMFREDAQHFLATLGGGTAPS